MQLVILAGGKGTRLGNIDIPKCLVKINNKPILQYQIELALKYGITDIYIMASYFSQQVKDFLSNFNPHGTNIQCRVDDQLRGTAGCLVPIKSYLIEPFMVFYGDLMMDFNVQRFIDYANEGKRLCTLISHVSDHLYDSDVIEMNNYYVHVFSRTHKSMSHWTNAGVYILSPDIFKYINVDDYSDFTHDIFPAALMSGEVIKAYCTDEYIKDIGTPERLEQVKKQFGG